MSRYKEHKRRWCDCDACDLESLRNRVVCAKGQIPCDVLFIGEAPGVSEDTIGKPFVGPAGKLLDRMIRQSNLSDYRLAFTNLVGCIPLEEKGSKFQEPPLKSIRACRPRLEEFIEISKPSVIVCVGTLAKKHSGTLRDRKVLYRNIIHPAAILRLDVSQKSLAIQRTIATLKDIEGDLIPF